MGYGEDVAVPDTATPPTPADQAIPPATPPFPADPPLAGETPPFPAENPFPDTGTEIFPIDESAGEIVLMLSYQGRPRTVALNNRIAEMAQELLTAKYGPEHGVEHENGANFWGPRGGRLTEAYRRNKDTRGTRGSSWSDLAFTFPNGRIGHINTTEVRADGRMTSRERQAFERLVRNIGDHESATHMRKQPAGADAAFEAQIRAQLEGWLAYMYELPPIQR